MIFLLAGAVPLYALSLLYGALVLRFKESGALVQIAQSRAGRADGAVLPDGRTPAAAARRRAALAAHLDHPGYARGIARNGYLLATWPRDLAVLLGMTLLLPPLANWALRRTERELRGRGGLGES